MLSRRGQNTFEYISVVAGVAAVLVIMVLYFKQAGQGHLRKAADEHGDLFNPLNVVGSVVQQTNQRSSIASRPDGSSTTTIENDQQTVNTRETSDVGLDQEKLF